MNSADNDSPVIQFRGMTWDSGTLITWLCAVSPVLQMILFWSVATHVRLSLGPATPFGLPRPLPLLIRLHELFRVASLAFAVFAIARLIVVSIHKDDFKRTGKALAAVWVVYGLGWAAWIGSMALFPNLWGAWWD